MSTLRRRLGRQDGAVLVLVAVTMVGLLATAGLVADAGIAFAQRRNLQSLADGAARTGAMSIDLNALRRSNGIALDPAAASSAVRSYLRTHGFAGTTAVSSNSTTVSVTLSMAQPTVLMKLFGIGSVFLRVHARAHPRYGITAPGR